MNLKNKRIIISKTNQIGDVTFSLPMASALKALEPSCHIIFLARDYTRQLVEHYQDVDEFADWEKLSQAGETALIEGLRALHADIIIHVVPNKMVCHAAKQAHIPMRIGTSRKLISWFTCNRLVSVARSKSSLHETQLDMQLLKPLGGKKHYSLEEIISLQHYQRFPLTEKIAKYIDSNKFNLILHPKTRGEKIEWSPSYFAELIRLLPTEKFQILVTGNAREGEQVRAEMLTPFPHVVDLCGKLSLTELLELIANADGMVCASTGPLHLAANFGLHTLGLYAPIRPFHAGRWGPVGKQAETITIDKNCDACRPVGQTCHCINEITPQRVYTVVSSWLAKKPLSLS